MATLTFTVGEALDILRANGLLPDVIKDVRPGKDGLRIAISGGIEIAVRLESCRDGVLRLSYSSGSWAFALADKAGLVEAKIDEAIRPHPFLRRDGKSLELDLNGALQARVKGLRVGDFQLLGDSIRIDLQ